MSITFKGTPFRCVFESKEKDNDYRMYAVDTDDVKVKRNKYGNVSILGNMPQLTIESEYTITANEEFSRGDTVYRVKSCTRDVPLTEEGTRLFLSEILPYSQVNEIMREYPNIIELVTQNRMHEIDLSKLYNIKQERIKIIQRKILENFVFAQLVDEFKGLISFNVIRQLYREYEDVNVVKNRISEDPYGTLCRVGDMGFKTADKLLLDFELEMSTLDNPPISFTEKLKTSSIRMEACIDYVLKQNETNGNTKMEIDELKSDCKKLTPECIVKLDSVLANENTIVFSGGFASRRETYDAEVYIANRLLEMVNSDNIWELDLSEFNNEYGMTQQQLGVIRNVKENNLSILNGYGGCVDSETEFFNGEKWKKISEYTEGEMVLQFNDDKSAELVSPNEYHKYESDDLYLIRNYGGSVQQVLSLDHDIVYMTSKMNLGKKKVSELIEMHHNRPDGFTGKFINAFEYKGGNGIELSDEWLRIMVAVFADGSFYGFSREELPSWMTCRFHIKKERKKERLRMLFSNADIEWRETESAKEGYTDLYIQTPMRQKIFPTEWYNANKHQLEIIADEVLHWDGAFGQKGRRSFSTTIKSDADFIQFVFSSLGYTSNISMQDRRGQFRGKYERKTVEYEVSPSINKWILSGIASYHEGQKINIEKYTDHDGYKYCFSVPSGMLVLRRSDKIFITGNSGKSFTTKALVELLQKNKKTVTICAPTGKAAKQVSGYANHTASTIHRLLYSLTQDGFTSKIPTDIVIVDEMSMPDAFLFKWLLESIDSSKTKLLLIGDSAQISSIGAGNLLHDMLNSKVIPTTWLDKIFRYGEGGIMTVATNTRMGQSSFENKAGIQVFGVDKDYTFIASSKPSHTFKTAIQLYEKLLKTYLAEDVIMMSPYNIGDLGSIAFNEAMQPIANPLAKGSDIFIEVNKIKFYIGDMIMQTKNNYKSPKFIPSSGWDTNDSIVQSYFMEDMNVAVFNGDIGKIDAINKDFALINFDGIKVVYSISELMTCQRAYSINTYKLQGSNAKIIILITGKEHARNLTSNLLYVAQTRAREKVYHIGDVKTVNESVGKKDELNRKTYLKELLERGIK